MEICLRGIPEAKCEKPDDRIKSDLYSVRSVVKQLGVESKVTILKRIGLLDNKSTKPRLFVFHIKDEVDGDLLIKSARN